MKKIFTLLFAVLCISLSAQRLTLSDAIVKDEMSIHQQIQKNEQDLIKYPLTYSTTNKWKEVKIKEGGYLDVEDFDSMLIRLKPTDYLRTVGMVIDSLEKIGYKVNTSKWTVSSHYISYYRTYLYHIFICKNGMGVPCEMYSKSECFPYDTGKCFWSTEIDDYVRGVTKFE